MSGTRSMSYAQLNEAFSWIKDQEGENFVRLEDEGADLTDVMIRLGNGAYRSALPTLSDREPGSHQDVEDAIIARLDGDVETDDDGEDDDFAHSEDDYSPYESVYDAHASLAEQDEHGAWLQAIEDAAENFAASNPRVVEQPIAFTIQVTATAPSAVEHAPANDDAAPAAISGWRASLTDPTVDLRLDNGTGGYRCWKDTTKAPTQFLRHVNRIQPTFRRSQARVA